MEELKKLCKDFQSTSTLIYLWNPFSCREAAHKLETQRITKSVQNIQNSLHGSKNPNPKRLLPSSPILVPVVTRATSEFCPGKLWPKCYRLKRWDRCFRDKAPHIVPEQNLFSAKLLNGHMLYPTDAYFNQDLTGETEHLELSGYNFGFRSELSTLKQEKRSTF